MALSNINKILKSVGKGGNKLVSTTMKTTDSAADIAKGLNNALFKDIPKEELAREFSPAKHLFKRKAKVSTNLIAFGGLTAFGTMSGFEKEADNAKLGEISVGQLEGLTDNFVSPTVDRVVQEQQRNPELMQEAIQKNSQKYGSAGPDLVFALHNLKNR